MTKILAALRANNNNKRVINPGNTNTPRDGSFHDPAELTRRTRAKRRIRTLAAPFTGQQGGPGVTYATQGGSTNWKSSPAAEGLTDNPNAKFDPSPQPGSVTVKRAPIVKSENISKGDKKVSGHGKTIKAFTGSVATRGMKLRKR